MNLEFNESFDVFKPVGHVVVSLPTRADADAAALALDGLGLESGALHRLTDREMLDRIDDDLQHAGALASIGQELNLVKAHRALAERGYHWLVVRVHDDATARAVAERVRPHRAERAQHYGHFVIEELLEPPTPYPQVAESPDRGLDAQTRSGREEPRRAAPDAAHADDASAAGEEDPGSAVSAGDVPGGVRRGT